MRNSVTAVMLGASALLAAAPPSAARARRSHAIGETLLSARSAYSTGPIAFFTEFFNVSYLTPALPSSPHDPGQIRFGSINSHLTITFPKPTGPVRVTCYFGALYQVHVHQVFSPSIHNPAIDKTDTANGNAPFIIDMPDFGAPMDSVVIDIENTLPAEWTLDYCSISPRP